MLTTTLNNIRKHNPCKDGWEKLLKHLGKTHADDEPLPYSVIVESNGLEDTLWCCRAEPQYDAEWREFACWCALSVKHLWDMPEIVARYLTTKDERIRDATREAAWAAARDAAWDAARAAVRDAAWDAARAASRSAAGAASRSAAGAASRSAAGAAQTTKFLEIVNRAEVEK